MTDDALAAPIEKLMSLGEPKYTRGFDWPNYLLLGLTWAHVPGLIEIATDQALFNLSDEHDPRGWAPVHAWRALGQLRAGEAITPLMRLFHEVKDNDWVIEELPDVFAIIGLSAYQPLVDYFNNLAFPAYSRLVAATSIMQIALLYPEVHENSVETLSAQLARYEQNSPGMNGVLIAELIELKAAEKADLIHKAFEAGRVDRFIVGDWRDVKNRLTQDPALATKNGLAKTVDVVPPDPHLKPE